MAETRTYRIVLEVTLEKEGDEFPSSQDVCEMAEDAMGEYEATHTAEADPCPMNFDQDPQGSVDSAMNIIEQYVQFLAHQARENNVLEFFSNAVNMAEHALTDARATQRCIRQMDERMKDTVAKFHQMMPNAAPMQAVPLTVNNLEQFPEPVLHEVAHAMVHKLNLELDCNFHAEMSREELIDWINNTHNEHKNRHLN